MKQSYITKSKYKTRKYFNLKLIEIILRATPVI